MSQDPSTTSGAGSAPGRRRRVAILVVNGGKDPRSGRWLELCLDKLREHTSSDDYHLFVWNNNLDDAWVPTLVSAFQNATLVQATRGESLAHPHAVPLQRLYEVARSAGFEQIVCLDSDAHPIASGWLTRLVDSVDERTVLAGVWRDELDGAIRPYVHPCCLCTSTRFLEDHALRLDHFPEVPGERHDTLSELTNVAFARGFGVHKLERSNRNQFHRLLGGLYGDLVYHHGAGSRTGVNFWGEPRTRALSRKNSEVRDDAAALLFQHYDEYIQWLRGHAPLDAASGHSEFWRALLELKETCRRIQPAPDSERPRHALVRRWSRRLRHAMDLLGLRPSGHEGGRRG